MSPRREHGQEDKLELKMTSMIDVVFLLLIFFMITTTFVARSGLQIRVPEADATRASPEEARVEVMVTEDGKYLVNGQGVPREADLAELLRQEAENGDSPLLVIRADRDARHAAVVEAMDAGSSAGLSRVAISTVTPPEERAHD